MRVMAQQQYCLKWNSFYTNMSDVFQNMLRQENLVDVTLACDGASIKAHKMILAACSPYFQNLFVSNPCKHPIVILKDVKFSDLKSIIDFIYCGQVNVPQDQLSALLKTADTLKIKGLAEVGDKQAKAHQVYESLSFKTKKRKRNRNKNVNLSNQQNSESGDTSEEDENNIPNKVRNENNIASNYSGLMPALTYRGSSQRSNFSPKNISPNTQIVNKDKDRASSVDELEPIKMLEQSMSTPEISETDNLQEGILVTPDVQHITLDDDENEDIKDIVLMEEEFSMNSNQYNDSSLSHSANIANQSTPQTIQEYENLLAEIQRKNLTVCPVCSKEFIKKSKLVRHYHTHFSNFRPKFSCGFCGKLFTTQDWCKRHAINCGYKISQIGQISQMGQIGFI